MRLIVLLFILFLFVLFSNQALAHTSLQESSPKDGEIITEPIQELSLIFGTKIEQTSKVRVTNSDEESITLGNFVIEEDEMWATFLQPLENGNYEVKWTIVGADGHPIDGDFSFTVNVPRAEPPAEEQKEEPTQGKEKEVNTGKEQKQEFEQNKLPSYIIPLTIGVLILIVIGSIWWLTRRED